MEKDKRIKSLNILILLIIVIATGWHFFKNIELLKDEYEHAELEWEYVRPTEIIGIQHFGKNKQNLLVQMGSSTKGSEKMIEENEIVRTRHFAPQYSKKYLIQQNSKVRFERREAQEIMVDYFELIVYSIGETELEKYKVIPVVDRVEAYQNNWEPNSSGPIFQYNNQEYIEIAIRDKESEQSKNVYLNIETEEIIEKLDEQKSPTEYKISHIVNYKDSEKFIPYYHYDANLSAIIFTKHESEDLSQGNLSIFFPEIASDLKKGKNITVLIYEKIDSDTVLKLLVPKDQNPYEGMILDAEKSIDYQEHEIHSMKEFIKWYKGFSDEERENTLENE